VNILFLLPFPQRLLAFASGVQAIAQALTRQITFKAEIQFVTLEDDSTLSFTSSVFSPAACDVIFVGLTNPANVADYFTMIDLLGWPAIRPASNEIPSGQPLVCAGGWGTANPEAFANLIDVIFVGNAIDSSVAVCEILGRYGRPDTLDFWREIAAVPGVYVPQLYHFRFESSGAVQAAKPKYVWAPAKVSFGVDTLAADDLLAFDGETAVLTATRGCVYHCAYCPIGCEPYRETPLEILDRQITEVAARGARQIIVNAATLSRHAQANELLDILDRACRQHPDLTVIIGSLRADELSPSWLQRLNRLQTLTNTLGYYTGGKREACLTLAPEVGSDEIRLRLGKALTNAQIFETICTAQLLGFTSFMLYFIVGFDFHAQVADIIAFIRRTLQLTAETQARIVVRITPFMPMAHTPMQRFGLLGIEKTWQLIDEIRDAFAAEEAARLEFSCAMTPADYIYQALCGRGDRRVSHVLLKLYQRGLNHRTTDPSAIQQVLHEEGVDLDWYLRRISIDEIVPWVIVDEIPDRIQRSLLEKLKVVDHQSRQHDVQPINKKPPQSS
jgi:radical SAM superfamily enzyme YgiQ (UPF0313 family)